MDIRIVLYDDNEPLRTSIEALIADEPGLQLIASFSGAEHTAEDLRVLQPDVILMDIDMPGVNGVQAVKNIRKMNSDIPVIMLTVFDDNDNIFKAVCAGASGYILKNNVIGELPGAIRNVLAGGAPMTGTVARKVLQMVPRAANDVAEFGLTRRETEILQLLEKGYSYKMIAANSNISIDTVRCHIKSIYQKLQVHSATEAISKAFGSKLPGLLP